MLRNSKTSRKISNFARPNWCIISECPACYMWIATSSALVKSMWLRIDRCNGCYIKNHGSWRNSSYENHVVQKQISMDIFKGRGVIWVLSRERCIYLFQSNKWKRCRNSSKFRASRNSLTCSLVNGIIWEREQFLAPGEVANLLVENRSENCQNAIYTPDFGFWKCTLQHLILKSSI